MDESVLNIVIFLVATFAAALVTGLAGFAFGLIAAAVWLHILTPLQTATLIIAFGLVVQGVSVWTLREALRWSRLWPFLVGAALGVPLGVAVLGWARPDHERVGVGVLLILFSTYNLARPPIKPFTAGGALADAGVGFANGILGSLTGLAGILTTVWCGLRGWPRDQQRAVFQPIGVAIFAMSALWLGASGSLRGYHLVVRDRLARPAARDLGGLKLFGRLDEVGFRKVVLVLLLASGVTLLF